MSETPFLTPEEQADPSINLLEDDVEWVCFGNTYARVPCEDRALAVVEVRAPGLFFHLCEACFRANMDEKARIARCESAGIPTSPHDPHYADFDWTEVPIRDRTLAVLQQQHDEVYPMTFPQEGQSRWARKSNEAFTDSIEDEKLARRAAIVGSPKNPPPMSAEDEARMAQFDAAVEPLVAGASI